MLKQNSSGDFIRHKPWLVAKGYSQARGVDYCEVLTPIVRWNTIRFLLAHVARHDMELKQVDVSTALLHGSSDENIYVELPSVPKDVLNALMKSHVHINEKVELLC